MRKVRSVAGDSVNLLLYRESGRSDDQAEEALWQLYATRAEHGPVWPAGIWVTLPELDSRPAAIKPVLAWD